MQSHAHGNRAHGMFPDTEMDITAFIAPRAADHAVHAFFGELGL